MEDKKQKTNHRRNAQVIIGILLGVTMIWFFLGKSNASGDNCIIRETWGAYSKEDLEKIVEYSVNNELTLLQKMINDGKTVHLLTNTKIIIENNGFLKSQIRITNGLGDQIWVVSESIGKCN